MRDMFYPELYIKHTIQYEHFNLEFPPKIQCYKLCFTVNFVGKISADRNLLEQ